MRGTIYFFVFLFYLTSNAQSFYHDYYNNMISSLRATLMDRDTLWLNEIKPDTLAFPALNEAFKQDHIEKCISGKSDDVLYFYDISMTLVDRLYYDRKVCTKNEIDSIESWWKRNEMVITPDFLRDILWTIHTVYDYGSLDWVYYLKPKRQDEAMQRIFDRIKYRQKKQYSPTETNSYLLRPNDRELFEALLSSQEEIHRIFTDHIIVESIIPRYFHANYVYTLKKLMTGERYDTLTPVSRREFEDMRDWWFINIDTIDFKIVNEYYNYFEFDIPFFY